MPYAGKTTLRKELVKRFGFEFLNIDEIMEEKGMWKKDYIPTQEDWDNSYSEGYEQVKKLLENNKNVVFDLGNLRFKEREAARKLAENLNIKHKLIYINTPIGQIKKRRLENKKTKKRGHISDWLFKISLNMFEKPTAKENPIIYDSGENLEKWIKENIN